MNNATTMDTEKTLLDVLAEHWKSIAVLGGAFTLIIGYVKLIRGKWKAFREWFRCFINAPTAIEAIRTDLALENGLSFRQWAAGVDDGLQGIRRMLTFETIARRTFWDSLATPIFEAAVNGDFQWANKAYLTMVESPMSEVIGRNWRNAIAGPERQQVIDGWELAVRDGTDFKAKFRLATDTGEKWVRFDVICNKDDLGNVLGFTGKMWEIPDPRQAGVHISEC